MSTEWLLIPVFILCALIMKWFVKLVDYFIAHSIIQDEMEQETSRHHAADKAGSSRPVSVQSGSAAKTRKVSFSADKSKDGAALADEGEVYAASGSEIRVSRVSAESFRKAASSAAGVSSETVGSMAVSSTAEKSAVGSKAGKSAASSTAGRSAVNSAAGKSAVSSTAGRASGGAYRNDEDSEHLPEKLTLTGLLDKFRKNSNVRHDKDANTIEIGTARPTQIRIHHYEQQ